MSEKVDTVKLEAIYTVEEVASHMRCSPQYIYKRIKKGTVKAIKFGGYKIKESEFYRIMEEKYEKD